jgi:hypothetical protein
MLEDIYRLLRRTKIGHYSVTDGVANAGRFLKKQFTAVE